MAKVKIVKEGTVYAIGEVVNCNDSEAEEFKASGYAEDYKDLEVGVCKVIAAFFDKKDLATQFFRIQPFFYDKSKLWWFWNKERKCWERVDETDMMNEISNACDSANTIGSKEKGEIIEALKQVGRRKVPKPVKPTWIQFKDRIFDIETGDEFDSTPEYFVTNPIPYELHKEKHMLTPNMDRVFTEWVGKEHLQTLYEILAYSLIPDYPIHRIFCFIGEGMNGKSKYLELLRKFIGNDNCCSTELDTLLQSRFEVTRLHKKLVCQMGETNFNEMNKTSILKKLSGGDLIGFEYKNKDPFEENNYAKIIIATNNLPTTTDKTIGFYRRWLIIDFPNRFSEKKDILKDIPEEEYECLAVRCASILKDLLDNRKFTNEGSVDERMKRYEEKSNPLKKFWDENIEEGFKESIFKYEFKDKLNEWCKENRFREISDRSVSNFMKENHIETRQIQAGWFSKDGKKPILRAWYGIKWK